MDQSVASVRTHEGSAAQRVQHRLSEARHPQGVDPGGQIVRRLRNRHRSTGVVSAVAVSQRRERQPRTRHSNNEAHMIIFRATVLEHHEQH